MRAFHVAIYFNEKCSELYKYVAVGEGTCCRRIKEIGAMLSGDIIYFFVLCHQRTTGFYLKLEFHIAIYKYENIQVSVTMSPGLGHRNNIKFEKIYIVYTSHFMVEGDLIAATW